MARGVCDSVNLKEGLGPCGSGDLYGPGPMRPREFVTP